MSALPIIWREFRRALREMDGLRVLLWEFLSAHGLALPYPQRAPVPPPVEEDPAPPEDKPADKPTSRFHHLEV